MTTFSGIILAMMHLVSPFYGELKMKRDYTFQETEETFIGSGTYGNVYRGTLYAKPGKWPQRAVAVKVLKGRPKDARELQNFMREVEIMSSLYHPALTNYVACSLGRKYVIVSELAHMSLQKLIFPNSGVPKQWKRSDGSDVEWNSTMQTICLMGVACGIAHIHEKGLIHRDLKPDNVIMDEDMYPRICDFGLARMMPTDEELEQHVNMTLALGTPLFMAPEVFDPPTNAMGLPYDQKADVYSYAMIVFSVFTGDLPFRDKRFTSAFSLFNAVKCGSRPTLPDTVPETWREIITRCWDGTPDMRPTMDEIKKAMIDNPEAFFIDDSVDGAEVRKYLELVK